MCGVALAKRGSKRRISSCRGLNQSIVVLGDDRGGGGSTFMGGAQPSPTSGAVG